MRNLLAETRQTLEVNDKTVADVLWVGSQSGEFAISWQEFSVIANLHYDNGPYGQRIAIDLVVVGDGWWLEREESEERGWWNFKQTPRQTEALSFSWVRSPQSGTLWEMNSPLLSEK